MLMQKRFFIVGNWKMSPETMHEARALFCP